MRRRATTGAAVAAVAAGCLVGAQLSALAAKTVVDRASAVGIYDKTQTWNAATVDYDHDGDEDVWIGFHQWAASCRASTATPTSCSRPRVPSRTGSTNNGGTFGASTQIRAITTGQDRSVAAGDADGDGDIDVYGMVRSDTGNPNDFVFLRSGTSWTPVTMPSSVGDGDEVFALHPLGPSRPAQFLALNGGNSSPPGGTGGGPVQLLLVQP